MTSGTQSVAVVGDVIELVEPHITSGRWLQLLGNWELEAAGGPQVINPKGRTADRDALRTFSDWYRAGLVHRSVGITTAKDATGVVTHAGISHGFWTQDLGSEPDPRRVVQAIEAMPMKQVARPGEMFGGTNETAPGPIWSSWAETWSWWQHPPFAQVHGHTTPWNSHRQRFWDHVPTEVNEHTTVRDGHVVFRAAPDAHPFITVDCGLWDRSRPGALQPLVFDDATVVGFER
jgi:hypothetical protein